MPRVPTPSRSLRLPRLLLSTQLTFVLDVCMAVYYYLIYSVASTDETRTWTYHNYEARHDTAA